MASLAATSIAVRRQWWWLQLLPPPVARACERLLLRLAALWLNSPLRRLRLGQRVGGHSLLSSSPAVNDDYDEQMRSAGSSPACGAGDDDWRGLVNVGNTCFVNATLQCMAALPALRARVTRDLAALTRVAQPEERDGGNEEGAKQRQRLRVAETLLALLASLDGCGGGAFEDSDEEEGDSGDAADNDDDNEEEGEDAGSASGKQVPTRGASSSSDSNRIGDSNGKSAAGVDRETLCAQVRAFLDAAAESSGLVASCREKQEQQDAEASGAKRLGCLMSREFLSFLLELLHELLRPVRAATEPRALNDREQEYFRQGEAFYARELKKCHPLDPRTYTDVVSGLGDLRWQRFLRQNDSVVTDFFVGQIVRGSQCCSCANLTCLHQELRVLSLSVNASASAQPQSLASCLEAHRHAETLVDENRVFCEGYCHMKTSRNTQVLFQRAPPVLVVQLQRFKQSPWGPEKIGAPVSFPIGEKDNMEDFSSSSSSSSSSSVLDLTENMFVRNAAQRVLYALVAVCAHVGPSIDSGHYIAYVRRQRQQETEDRSSPGGGTQPAQWLRMDDDVVTVLDDEHFRDETLSTAYILFYVRVAS